MEKIQLMSHADHLAVEECSGLAGLEQLSERWYHLLEKVEAPHFNQYPDWYRAYFTAVGGAEKPVRFVSVSEHNELVAILPLMFEKTRLGVHKAKLPVDAGIYITDLVISDCCDKKDIWEFIQKSARGQIDGISKWDVLTVSAPTLETSAIAQTLRATGRAFESRKKDQCMIIDVEPYEEVIAGLKSKFRNNLKRSRRRLEEFGGVQYQWSESKEEALRAFEELVQLESAGWKGDPSAPRAGYPGPAAIALQEWKHNFYRKLVSSFADLEAIEILLVKRESQVIGAQLSIRLRAVNYLLKTTMDETIKGIAIGHLMLDELMKRLANRGDIRVINLLTDYAWHEPWRPHLVPYSTFVTYNNTLLGRIGRLRKQLRG